MKVEMYDYAKKLRDGIRTIKYKISAIEEYSTQKFIIATENCNNIIYVKGIDHKDDNEFPIIIDDYSLIDESLVYKINLLVIDYYKKELKKLEKEFNEI